MDLILLFSIFFALELFESNWQKADTFLGVVKNNYLVYKKSIILYFLLNATFIYSLYLAVSLNEFGFWMSSIVILKFVDIAFRLHLITKIDNDEPIDQLIPFDFKMTLPLRYMNAIIYPAMFLFVII